MLGVDEQEHKNRLRPKADPAQRFVPAVACSEWMLKGDTSVHSPPQAPLIFLK